MAVNGADAVAVEHIHGLLRSLFPCAQVDRCPGQCGDLFGQQRDADIGAAFPSAVQPDHKGRALCTGRLIGRIRERVPIAFGEGPIQPEGVQRRDVRLRQVDGGTCRNGPGGSDCPQNTDGCSRFQELTTCDLLHPVVLPCNAWFDFLRRMQRIRYTLFLSFYPVFSRSARNDFYRKTRN